MIWTFDEEKRFPICAECGDRITDDYFLRIGTECYHKDCVEEVSTETWLENHRYDVEEY